jgi:hypothetical protein
MNKLSAPRARPMPEPSEAKLSPANARRVREGIAQAERGEFADLTAEETRRYIETGELPQRTERWLDFHGSTDVT